ncbi:MAG: hypothetical protein AAFX99_25985 [Myxococcota bacterium]
MHQPRQLHTVAAPQLGHCPAQMRRNGGRGQPKLVRDDFVGRPRRCQAEVEGQLSHDGVQFIWSRSQFEIKTLGLHITIAPEEVQTFQASRSWRQLSPHTLEHHAHVEIRTKQGARFRFTARVEELETKDLDGLPVMELSGQAVSFADLKVLAGVMHNWGAPLASWDPGEVSLPPELTPKPAEDVVQTSPHDTSDSGGCIAIIALFALPFALAALGNIGSSFIDEFVRTGVIDSHNAFMVQLAGFVCLCVCFIVILLLIILRLAKIVTQARLEVEALRRDGLRGEALIVKVADTGTRLNKKPLFHITMTVTLSNQPPYTAVHQWLLSEVRIPHVQPGSTLIVAVNPNDRSRMTIVWPD